MPRIPRKLRGAQPAAPPPPSRKAREIAAGRMTQSFQFVRCVLCGVMAHRDRFVTPKTGDIVGIDAGPYEPVTRSQEFGGRRPREEGQKPQGAMAWSKTEPPDRDTLLLVREKLTAGLQMVDSMLGEAPKPKKRRPAK